MSNDREREMRLKAAELHGAMPEMPTITPREIYEYRYQDSLLGPCVRLSFHPMREKWKLEGIQYVDLALNSGRLGLSERTWNNDNNLTDDTIALLQEARRVMTRDGQGGAK